MIMKNFAKILLILTAGTVYGQYITDFRFNQIDSSAGEIIYTLSGDTTCYNVRFFYSTGDSELHSPTIYDTLSAFAPPNIGDGVSDGIHGFIWAIESDFPDTEINSLPLTIMAIPCGERLSCASPPPDTYAVIETLRVLADDGGDHGLGVESGPFGEIFLWDAAGNSDRVYRYNLSTGAVDTITLSPALGSGYIEDVEIVGDTLVIIPSTRPMLFYADKTTGAVFDSVDLSGLGAAYFVSGAYDGERTIYLIDRGGFPPFGGHIYKYDIPSRTATDLGATSSYSVEGIAYNCGKLWVDDDYNSSNCIYIYDTTGALIDSFCAFPGNRESIVGDLCRYFYEISDGDTLIKIDGATCCCDGSVDTAVLYAAIDTRPPVVIIDSAVCGSYAWGDTLNFSWHIEDLNWAYGLPCSVWVIEGDSLIFSAETADTTFPVVLDSTMSSVALVVEICDSFGNCAVETSCVVSVNPPLLSNFWFSEETDTDWQNLVVVHYELSGTSSCYEVSAEISFDGGTTWTSLSTIYDTVGGYTAPNVGSGVQPGEHEFVWDLRADFPDIEGSNYQMRLIAGECDIPRPPATLRSFTCRFTFHGVAWAPPDSTDPPDHPGYVWELQQPGPKCIKYDLSTGAAVDSFNTERAFVSEDLVYWQDTFYTICRSCGNRWIYVFLYGGTIVDSIYIQTPASLNPGGNTGIDIDRSTETFWIGNYGTYGSGPSYAFHIDRSGTLLDGPYTIGPWSAEGIAYLCGSIYATYDHWGYVSKYDLETHTRHDTWLSGYGGYRESITSNGCDRLFEVPDAGRLYIIDPGINCCEVENPQDTVYAVGPLDSYDPRVSLDSSICAEPVHCTDSDTVVISWSVEDSFWFDYPCSVYVFCGDSLTDSFAVEDTFFAFSLDTLDCFNLQFAVATYDSFANRGTDTTCTIKVCAGQGWADCPVPCRSYTSCEDQIMRFGLWDPRGIGIDTTRIYFTVHIFHAAEWAETLSIALPDTLASIFPEGDTVMVEIQRLWEDGDSVEIILDSAFTVDGCKIR